MADRRVSRPDPTLFIRSGLSCAVALLVLMTVTNLSSCSKTLTSPRVTNDPLPTATWTPWVSATCTNTGTATPTRTNTFSVTSTCTGTWISTNTQSPSPFQTFTLTPTFTVTPSATPTPTETLSGTPALRLIGAVGLYQVVDSAAVSLYPAQPPEVSYVLLTLDRGGLPETGASVTLADLYTLYPVPYRGTTINGGVTYAVYGFDSSMTPFTYDPTFPYGIGVHTGTEELFAQVNGAGGIQIAPNGCSVSFITNGDETASVQGWHCLAENGDVTFDTGTGPLTSPVTIPESTWWDTSDCTNMVSAEVSSDAWHNDFAAGSYFKSVEHREQWVFPANLLINVWIGGYQSESVDRWQAALDGTDALIYPQYPNQPSTNSCVLVQVARYQNAYLDAVISISDGTNTYPLPLVDENSLPRLFEDAAILFAWSPGLSDQYQNPLFMANHGLVNNGNLPGGFTYQPGAVYTLDIRTPLGDFSASVTAPGGAVASDDGFWASWLHPAQFGCCNLTADYGGAARDFCYSPPISSPAQPFNIDSYSFFSALEGAGINTTLHNSSDIPGAIQDNNFSLFSKMIAFEYRDQFILLNGTPTPTP